MAPKKKSKVNKLAKMSDEERARYLQHRADMEEEARRRKTELISRFLQIKLEKEEAFSKTNTAKLNEEWRFILRRISCEQQKKEIQNFMTSFDLTLEKKDRLLRSLVCHLADADDQHRRMAQTHMETINQFLEIGNDRLVSLKDSYDTQRCSILDEWDKEWTELVGKTDQAEFHLRLMVFQQEKERKDYQDKYDNQVATAKNDARLAHEGRMSQLVRPKEVQLESYWNQLRETYSNYLERHGQVMSHYSSLKEKDDFYRRDIFRNAERIARTNKQVSSLQKEWLRSSQDLSSRLTSLRQEREGVAASFWRLKSRAKTQAAREEEMLSCVVTASEDAVKNLEDKQRTLDKILQLSSICAKYENKEDQDVMHQLAANSAPSETTEYEYLDQSMIEECKQMKKLNRFFVKMNRVKVQIFSLRAEKKMLLKQNEQIRSSMKSRLTELALQGEERPSTVGHATGEHDIEALKLRAARRNRPVTCIEGALSNAVRHERRMKLERKNQEMMAIRSYPRVCWQ